MTWIKLDDKCPRHPKVAGLSDRAFRWWIQALCYASEFLTDGLLPPSFLRTIPPKARAELLTSGLFAAIDADVWIHDYLGHQTGRADVERERERNRHRRTGGVPPGNQREPAGKPPPENREQIQRTEADPAKSAGGATPREPWIPKGAPNSSLRWGLKHGACVTGFCDWICLPEEDFNRYSTRLGGSGKAMAWAQSVRTSGVVPTGKPWAFWNSQFDAAHGSETADRGGFTAAEWAAQMPGGAIDKKLGIV